jgi:hypothetical protein
VSPALQRCFTETLIGFGIISSRAKESGAAWGADAPECTEITLEKTSLYFHFAELPRKKQKINRERPEKKQRSHEANYKLGPTRNNHYPRLSAPFREPIEARQSRCRENNVIFGTASTVCLVSGAPSFGFLPLAGALNGEFSSNRADILSPFWSRPTRPPV